MRIYFFFLAERWNMGFRSITKYVLSHISFSVQMKKLIHEEENQYNSILTFCITQRKMCFYTAFYAYRIFCFSSCLIEGKSSVIWYIFIVPRLIHSYSSSFLCCVTFFEGYKYFLASKAIEIIGYRIWANIKNEIFDL